MGVSIPSFLPSSLHPSICGLHYVMPCLSHYILIVLMLWALPFMHWAASFHSIASHKLPLPPSLFNAPIYKHLIIPPSVPLSGHPSIYTAHYSCTFRWAFPFVYLIMAPSSMCMSLLPLKCSPCITSFYVCILLHPMLPGLTKQTNKIRQINRLFAFRELNMFLRHQTSVFCKRNILSRDLHMFI